MLQYDKVTLQYFIIRLTHRSTLSTQVLYKLYEFQVTHHLIFPQ